VRFYVPEWEDHVDAHYDFEHDEHSSPHTSERDWQYIWDIFDYETTPIDGVLISREQVEGSQKKYDRLVNHGVYHNGSGLNIPDWMPTISDCGAWGYKSKPFPPYDNDGMLAFYEDLGVSTGVTIDHLVLGTGHQERLYLDDRAFHEEFSADDIPESLIEDLDLMVDTWPDRWPSYVGESEPSIYGVGNPEPFDSSTFEGPTHEVLSKLDDDPRAVYREDDTDFRYQLTLENARKMRELYEAGDYSFRLMVAIQGWDAESYANAARTVLDLGYNYIGLGGVAGSNVEDVRKTVTELGTVVKDYERGFDTRVDTHVFGFAKTDAFETVGRSGMTSFDSASMLRSAWTGGKNYHLDSDRKYDAIRVRFPSNRADLETTVETALRGQELLHALRAFDEDRSIADAIDAWLTAADAALAATEDYLREHRFDDRFDATRLRDIEAALRADFEHAGELKASFGDPLRSRIQKLLREDDSESPVSFEEYTDLLDTAEGVFEAFSSMHDEIDQLEREHGEEGTLKQVWTLLTAYAEWIGDEDHLGAYEKTLRNEPWRDCSCPICTEHGIEVAIFRGNNRNRRRGFHNTRKFYDEFEADLPSMLVATKASAGLSRAETVETYLRANEPDFWGAVHDLPVTEIGTVSANGVHEWWDDPPTTLSFAPTELTQMLSDYCVRYQDLFMYTGSRGLSEEVREAVEARGVRFMPTATPKRCGPRSWIGSATTTSFSPRGEFNPGLRSSTDAGTNYRPVFGLEGLPRGQPRLYRGGYRRRIPGRIARPGPRRQAIGPAALQRPPTAVRHGGRRHAAKRRPRCRSLLHQCRVRCCRRVD